MNKYVRILASAAPFMVLQLFSEDSVVAMNNAIYTVYAEFFFKCDPAQNQKCKQSRAIPAGKSVRIAFPQVKKDSAYGVLHYKNAYLESIKVTIPAEQEPIWANGKVGSNVVGIKNKRAEKSFVFRVGSKGDESATFVINADRNLNFINDILHVKNLSVYRFIQ